jgi:chlorobactene glucosyltransferase
VLTAPVLSEKPKNLPSGFKDRPALMMPRVSVLIPARDEEHNIGKCLDGLLQQAYQQLEIIVLDDQSTDGTARIVQEYVAAHRLKIKFLRGLPMPEGWTGKNWACQQLSSAATGEVLIFTDADNRHAPEAVQRTVEWMSTYELGLLSAFPQQEVVTMPEKLAVPVIDMFVYGGLPLWLTYEAEHTSLSAANGQWLAFNREAYTQIGGHMSVRNHVVEDVELARTIKQRGIKMLTVAGTGAVFCRMYRSFDEVWNGFTKNIFGLVRYNTDAFFAMLGMLFAVCIVPYFMVFFAEYRWLALAAILMNMLLRGALAWRFKHPLLESVLLHPVGVGFMIVIGVNSYRTVKKGAIQWKNRAISIKLSERNEDL